jgi:UDP-N-acetylmuramoylalanine--D-glutamate ligase
VDWSDFAEAMRGAASASVVPAAPIPRVIVTLGQNGPKIHALLAGIADAAGFALAQAADLPAAVAEARRLLGGDGVVLLSPGAPSFGAYRDYTERGRHFAALAGFDPEAIAAIPGLGIG